MSIVNGSPLLSRLNASVKTRDKALAERDQLILQARLDGWRWRDIADAAEMTEMSCRKAATRANGGELPYPKQ